MNWLKKEHARELTRAREASSRLVEQAQTVVRADLEHEAQMQSSAAQDDGDSEEMPEKLRKPPAVKGLTDEITRLLDKIEGLENEVRRRRRSEAEAQLKRRMNK